MAQEHRIIKLDGKYTLQYKRNILGITSRWKSYTYWSEPLGEVPYREASVKDVLQKARHRFRPGDIIPVLEAVKVS